MTYNMIQLKKGVFELDFVKTEDKQHYACATNLANLLGMEPKYVNRIINKNKILKDASSKLKMRDSKNRMQSMVFIHSDHFLYFLSKIEGLKSAAAAPDFVTNLILIYPLFVKELQRKVDFLQNRMIENKVDQLRINKLKRIKSLATTEITRLQNRISERNTEEFNFEPYPDGSTQTMLELEDQFHRNTIEVEAEIIEE